MKKAISLILCVLLGAAVLPLLAFAANESYPIEAYYGATGEHEVASVLYDSGEQDYKHYKIWYPKDLETAVGKTYPVIVYCNGTGATYDLQDTQDEMNLLASRGFIMVTNDHEASGNGDSASKGLDLLLNLNQDESSIFYQKVDCDKIGVTGHSQGGSASINAASAGKYDNSSLIKSVCAVSAPHSELAASAWQKTPYDASKVQVPTFLIAGTGAFDSGTKTSSGICPLGMSLIANMKAINNDTVIIGRIKNADHDKTQPLSVAYVSAWFAWTLLGDEYAAGAFTGENPELARNDKWQDVYNKQSENLPENPDPYEPDAQPDSFFGKLFAKIAKLFYKVFYKIKYFFQSIFGSLSVAMNYSRYQT